MKKRQRGPGPGDGEGSCNLKETAGREREGSLADVSPKGREEERGRGGKGSREEGGRVKRIGGPGRSQKGLGGELDLALFHILANGKWQSYLGTEYGCGDPFFFVSVAIQTKSFRLRRKITKMFFVYIIHNGGKNSENTDAIQARSQRNVFV